MESREMCLGRGSAWQEGQGNVCVEGGEGEEQVRESPLMLGQLQLLPGQHTRELEGREERDKREQEGGRAGKVSENVIRDYTS